MDGAGSAGDAGFDAALKALDELESNGAPHAEVATPSIDIVSALAIDLAGAEPTVIAPAPAPASVMATAADDLETALIASMAEVAVATEPAPVPPAGPIAVTAHAATKPPRFWLLATGVATLGVFASLLSVVGLIVTSRTVAGATLVVADARERQQQMVKVGELLHDLEIIRTRQIEVLQRQQLAANNAPVSGEQFNKAIDNLRIDVGKRGPDADVIRTIHEGQLDTNQRINELSLKVVRIEAAVTGAH